MMEYDTVALLLLGALIVGGFIGWRIHMFCIIQAMIHFPDEVRKTVDELHADDVESTTIVTDDSEEITATGTEITIELENDIMYAYRTSNGVFVAQGNNIEELLKSAHARFPGQTFFGNLP